MGEGRVSLALVAAVGEGRVSLALTAAVGEGRVSLGHVAKGDMPTEMCFFGTSKARPHLQPVVGYRVPALGPSQRRHAPLGQAERVLISSQ